MESSDLLRIADVAKRLGFSPSKIYQLVAERKISHRRIGGAIRFDESDIREFLEASKRGRKSAESWPTNANPKATQGSMEAANALFNGSAFVPYGPGQYTPSPEQEKGNQGQDAVEKQREYDGMEM